MNSTLTNSDVQTTDNHLIIYPKDQEITIKDLLTMIDQNESWSTKYRENYDLYIGNHAILNQQKKVFGPDNRLVANLPSYIVNTYLGYFLGIAPKIALDDKQANDRLQDWNDSNSFQDKLTETGKLCDVYGRGYMFLYQDEDSKTRIATLSPDQAFMVYDDTINQQPLAFVTYSQNRTTKGGKYTGTVYYAKHKVDFVGDEYADSEQPNPYGLVPAVEFFNNTERQGVFDKVKTLCNALDKAMSQKSNNVEYFDDAFMVIAGLQLPTDESGRVQAADIQRQHLIYSPDAESANANVSFISKPDGDQLQEHYIDRVMDLIYQVAQVPNLNDKTFSGNNSGVALKYKLLAMQNMAAANERKFTQSLRAVYRILFSVSDVAGENAWPGLSFQFTRNMPADVEGEAQTAATLMGVVSHETAMKPLSIVDDPAAEMDKIRQEQADTVQNALTATDADKAGEDDGNKLLD